jgi:predicted protein tyrosine phosphatase
VRQREEVQEVLWAATLVEDYGQNPEKIICLDIPDICGRNDPGLVTMLEDKMCGYLPQEGQI